MAPNKAKKRKIKEKICKRVLQKRAGYGIIQELHGGIAQLVEYRSPKPWVVGSSPSAPANKKGTFVYQKFLFCLSIAKAMVYHHALACISSALTSISRQSEYIISRRLYPLSQ